MEISHGEEWIEGKCTKDKGHDLWYRPGPLAEFRQLPMHCLSYRNRPGPLAEFIRIPMRCLSYRSRQRQHPLQNLIA